jgi:multidrug efflux system membrane fusion protein
MNRRLRTLAPRGLAALVVLACASAWAVSCARTAPRNTASPVDDAAKRRVPVFVAEVVARDVPVWLEGLGSVAAFQQVVVRSQVDGVLQQVFFREGQYVRKGDLLAQIDPRRYQAALHQAEGALARDRAQVELARLNLDRFSRLREGDLVAQSDVDAQRSSVGQLEGALRVDEAAIENARLDLTYARIVSPLEGVLGVRLVDQGNLIHANDATGLVVVTQIEPIAVFFTMSQDNLDEVSAAIARGAAKVEVYDRDGVRRLGEGTLAVIDNQIVATTATIRLKAIVPNPDHALWPNQFVKARVLVDVRRGARVVPTSAIGRGPDGQFVYVVDAGNVARPRSVTVAGTDADQSLVASGLDVGERVVVEGQNALRAGSRVRIEARPPSGAAR